MKIQIEHIYSFLNKKSLESHLRLYAKEGFVVGKKTVRHPPGTRNGFFYIGPEYLEFLRVEDQKAYRKGKSNHHDTFRTNPGPFGFGFDAPQIGEFHKELIRKGIKAPRLFSRGPSDAKENDEPWWTFQLFPSRALPGIYPFALRYESHDYSAPRHAYIGKNGIFAISGVTLVSKTPLRDAKKWAKVFDLKVTRDGGQMSAYFGPHKLSWLRKALFRKMYGKEAFIPSSGSFAHLRKVALLHLYSEDLKRTRRYMKKTGRKVREVSVEGKSCLYIHPHAADGYSFLVSEKSLSLWKKERQKMQRIKIVRAKFR